MVEAEITAPLESKAEMLVGKADTVSLSPQAFSFKVIEVGFPKNGRVALSRNVIVDVVLLFDER